jgi:hypothetical protein
MSQSMNFTIKKPQWYSTPWSEVEYELIDNNSNRIFMISVETTSTPNSTSKPSQEDPQTNSKEYRFDNSDVHKSFGKMYGTTYKKAKEITFKQLYGGIFPEYKEIEFFKRVQKYIDELWDKFQNEGYVEVPISKWRFEKDKLENMKPQKLLNYLLQGLETAMNVCILWDIIKLLRGKNTKIVLYTYDSFLLDLDKTEKDIFKEIQNVFKKYKLQTKMSYGDNYDFR